MQAVLRYRGRNITETDVQFVREMISAHPQLNRMHLSRLLCERWDWLRQQNGAPREMVARGLMLALHRAGHIELPPRQRPDNNHLRRPHAQRSAPHPVEVDRSPLVASLKDLGPTTFFQMRRTPQEALFNWLIASEHPLGFVRPVGEHLKFMVFAGLRPVALFAWSSAPRHLGPRDQYIGWSKEQRLRGIRHVAYNTRYLILPWVRVPHLASHLLSRMTRMLSQEWEKVYHHPVFFAETFVDPLTHRGTCYRAANWVLMGRTTGRGKDDQTKKANRSLKDVWGLPLIDDFRKRLIRHEQ
jgi:Domain of unknown function (DUF4338)